MSMFNIVVPAHVLAPHLLLAIRWAQPLDSEKKYPLLGRMRYVWLTEENNVCILLKDGPNSWTEPADREALMAQITTHETYVRHYVYEKDPVYIIAEFKPFEWHPQAGETPVKGDLIAKWVVGQDVDLKAVAAEVPMRYHDIYEFPFDIFETELEHLGTNDEAISLGKDLINKINKIKE